MDQSIKKTHNRNDVVELVKKIDKLIKCNKNNILTLANQQGMIFKELKESSKFVNAVTEFEISKSTMNFKIDIADFIDIYPIMRNSCISLFHFKINFRIIKNICQEMLENFNNIFTANIFYYSKDSPCSAYGKK